MKDILFSLGIGIFFLLCSYEIYAISDHNYEHYLSSMEGYEDAVSILFLIFGIFFIFVSIKIYYNDKKNK